MRSRKLGHPGGDAGRDARAATWDGHTQPHVVAGQGAHREAVAFSASSRSTVLANSSVTWSWNAPLAGLAKPAWIFFTRPSRPMKNVVGHELRLTAWGTFSHISTGEPAIRCVYWTPYFLMKARARVSPSSCCSGSSKSSATIARPRSRYLRSSCTRNWASSWQFGHQVPVTTATTTLPLNRGSLFERILPSRSAKLNWKGWSAFLRVV